MPFSPLELPPARTRSTGPFAAIAGDMALLRAAIDELHRRTQMLETVPSPTVKAKTTPTGTILEAIFPPILRPAHPWKATTNGNEFITVGEGSILFPYAQGTLADDMAPVGYIPIHWAGGSIEVTANGYLYACAINEDPETPIPCSELALTDETIQLWTRLPSLADVAFSASAPGSYSPPSGCVAYWPIAQVTLSESVARVEKQILTHNPQHDLVTLRFPVP
jgi:hypothetical protein